MLIHRGRKQVCLGSTSTLDAYIVGKHMGSLLYSACVEHKIYAYLNDTEHLGNLNLRVSG